MTRSALEIQLRERGRLQQRIEGPGGMYRITKLYYQPPTDDWRVLMLNFDRQGFSMVNEDFEHVHAIFSRLAHQSYEDWAATVLAGESVMEMLDLV